MSINSIGLTGEDYQLISSVTPTAATSTVSFTSLGLHKKFLLVVADCANATAGRTSVRLNNDSTSKYLNSVAEWVSSASTLNVELSTQFRYGTATGTTNLHAAYLIENCDTTGAKLLTKGFTRSGTAYQINQFGIYVGTAVVSRIDFITTTTFSATGTVYLYGVK